MIFHSLAFVVFFVVVVIVYWRLPHRAQNVFLLGASYLFYGWIQPWFVARHARVDDRGLLGRAAHGGRSRAQEAVSLGQPGREPRHARLLQVLQLLHRERARRPRQRRPRRRRCRRSRSCCPPASRSTPSRRSATPSTSTRARCARAGTRSTSRCSSRSSRIWSPGPIMRAQNLLVQVERPRAFSADAARSGLVLMAWGFFKKLVVADNVAVIANRVFAHDEPTFEIALGRRLRVRHSDLRRLLRLLGHRARRRALVRLRADRQLQPSVHRAQPDGLLAALAHLAVDVVPRLRLHPARRQPRAARCSARSTCWRRSSFRGSGTARAGTSCCGGSTTACWCRDPHPRPAAAPAGALAGSALSLCRSRGTFVLMMAGWLFFRETNPDYLIGLSDALAARQHGQRTGVRPSPLRPRRHLGAAARRQRSVGACARALDAVQSLDRGPLRRASPGGGAGPGGGDACGADAGAAEPRLL